MTNFYDNNKMLTIAMTDTNTGYDWENDFFGIGSLPYSKELNAYKVNDIQYLADYAESYANGTNGDCEYEQNEDGDIILLATTVNYTIKNI